MSRAVHVAVLKSGRPTVAEARARLAAELETARRQGATAVKLIHGFGSSGVGGKIRLAVRSSLRKRQKEGLIRGFVPGEKWDVFEESARRIIEDCPQLRKDADLNNANEGITIVLL